MFGNRVDRIDSRCSPTCRASNPLPQSGQICFHLFCVGYCSAENVIWKGVLIAIKKMEDHWLRQKLEVQERRFRWTSYFSGKKKGLLFLFLYLTRQGVLKYYGSTCAFKIATIFLNHLLVMQLQKVSKIITSIFDS